MDLVHSLQRVDPAEWDGLVHEDDPFTTHAFLWALEQSGCVGPGTGWQPCHLLARDEDGALRAAMPLYLKGDSFGEYVFDWSWAEAAVSAGIPYYPKLVSAVPFTPVTGRRLLLAPRQDPGLRDLLLQAAQQLAVSLGASSIHWLFPTREEHDLLVRQPGCMSRLDYQFHWTNPGYTSFEHYVAALRAPARKNLRHERERAAASGLELVTLCGEAISDAQFQALYRFYRDTTSRKWGRAYLNREFFQLLRQNLGPRLVATLALDGDRPVAGALNVQRGQVLYGRYWGSLVRQDSLHFELCYHRPIELCIDRGFSRFEAGAQGSHKLKRGLVPAATHSVHWVRHPALARAVEQFLQQERVAVQREMEAVALHGPFRRDAQEISTR